LQLRSRASEEALAELGFEIAHAQADGSRRDAKLAGSAREARIAHARFENSQRFDRGQASGHGTFQAQLGVTRKIARRRR